MDPTTRQADRLLLAIGVALLVAALVDVAWLHSLAATDRQLSDALIRTHARTRVVDREIVIVDIDERSLAAMADSVGRFPWPRSVYGELIRELERQGARAIVMDVELYEPDRLRPEHDEVLNEVLEGSTRTFFPLRLLERVAPGEGVHLATFAKPLALIATGPIDPEARQPMQLPFVLDRSAWGRTGLVNFLEDSDGVGRRYLLHRDVGGWRLPSLPARVATSLGYALPEGDAFHLAWFAGAFPHARVSLADLYADVGRSQRTRPADEFKGRIVIIGSSATHLGDLRATPIAAITPGVEILATAIDNLKQGQRLQPLPTAAPLLVVLVLFLPLVMALERRWNLVRIAGLLAVATLALVGGAYLSIARGWLLPVATPLVFAWLFFFTASLRAWQKEQRAKEQREVVLSRFLDRRVVRNLVAEGVKLEDLKSESRSITVLFSDIRGFTALSETRAPEEVVAMLNRYLTLQSETVFRHGGTLDKYIGDAIMAFWGAPTDDAQHAEHAVACALDMANTLQQFNSEVTTNGVKLDIGIGINTGPAVVGFIGSKRKLEYTAIGDTVNLASRIEGETKGRTRVLVTAATRTAAGDVFAWDDWGTLVVKGRHAEVHVYAPRAREGAP